jgi:hypothetical protein
VISIKVFRKFIFKKVGGNYYTEYAVDTCAFCLMKTNMQEISSGDTDDVLLY